MLSFYKKRALLTIITVFVDFASVV